MVRTSLISMTLFLALTGWVADAHACSCAVPDAPTARDAATWVFEGVLLRTAGVGDPNAERSRGTFRVSRVWKGDVTAEVTVEIPALQSMCPPHLEVGGRYVLYVTGTADAPRVVSCARYASGSAIRAERRALGRPRQTFPE